MACAMPGSLRELYPLGAPAASLLSNVGSGR